MLARFIYGCQGIERYVELLVADADHVDTRFIVAESAGELIGSIEMRLLGELLFLNYVAVDSGARKRGVANRLLHAAIRSLRQPHHAKLALDVLSDNCAACAWYDSLGMTIESVTRWYEMPIATQTLGTNDIVFNGIAQARVCQERFGFSQMTLVSPRDSHAIGMLGDRWFRMTSADALVDPAVLGRLRELDPQRDVLALILSTRAVPSGCREVASTQRRSASLAHVAARLESAR
jgi:GNAT superfamily N-acetyltransferase